MFRLPFLLWPLAIASVAIGLFQIKYAVQEIDRNIRLTDQKLQNLSEEYQVLQTEWEFRNTPAELEQLAETYLGMKADLGTMVTNLDALPHRDGDSSGGTYHSSLPNATWSSPHESEQLRELPRFSEDAPSMAPQLSGDNPLADPLAGLIEDLGE